MKKMILLELLVSICLIPAVTAQEVVEKKGWPSSERYVFISECMANAVTAMGEDTARFYCYCMQEKIETRYPDIDDAAKITEADMNSELMQAEIRGCLSGSWPAVNRASFLSECITAAKAGMTEERAKNYCECAVYKFEKKIPDPAQLDKLTPEDLKLPEWKKLIQDCLDF